jgi:hypothetical protein
MRFRQFLWIREHSAQFRVTVPDALDSRDRILLMRLWHSITDSWTLSFINVVKIKQLTRRFRSTEWMHSQCTLDFYLTEHGNLAPVSLTLSFVDAFVCAQSFELAMMLALRQVPVVSGKDKRLAEIFSLVYDSSRMEQLERAAKWSRRLHLACLLTE